MQNKYFDLQIKTVYGIVIRINIILYTKKENIIYIESYEMNHRNHENFFLNNKCKIYL